MGIPLSIGLTSSPRIYSSAMFAIAACAVNLMVHSAMPAIAGVTKQKARTEPIKESVDDAASMMDMESSETGASFQPGSLATGVHGNSTRMLFLHITSHSHSETCEGVAFSEDYAYYPSGCQITRDPEDDVRFISYQYQCNGTHSYNEFYNDTTCTESKGGHWHEYWVPFGASPMGCVHGTPIGDLNTSKRKECDVTPPVVVKYSYYDNSQCSGVPYRAVVSTASSLGCGATPSSTSVDGGLKEVYTMDGTTLSMRTYATLDFQCTGPSEVVLAARINACVLYGKDM